MYRIDAGQRRRIGAQTVQQCIDLGLGTFGRNLDAFGIVAHPAGKLQLLRQTPDKGSEPDSLDDPGNPDATGDAIQVGSQVGEPCNLASSAAICRLRLSTVCRFAAIALLNPSRRKSSHSPRPSPLVAETRITRIAGLTRRA